MVSPDAGRGSGFGTPEQKQELMEERHADIAREIKMNREADQIRDAERSRPRASVPWWKRLFRSS